MNRTTTWTGTATLAAGLIIGFAPVSSHGSSCGSPYLAATSDTASPEAQALDYCDEVRSLARVPAIALTIIGGGIALAAVAGSRSDVDLTGHRTVLGRPTRRRDQNGEE